MSSEEIIRQWWGDDASWLDVPVVWVSGYCDRWKEQHIATLRIEQHGAPYVIVVSRASPSHVDVRGVVHLFHPGPTVGDALHAHRPPDVPAAIHLPPLLWLSLENAPRDSMMHVYPNMGADREWIERALHLMHQVAMTPASACEHVAAWGFTPEAQLASAKMRFFVKLCLSGMPDRLEMHREALQLGRNALMAWTRAYVTALCGTEKRARDLVRRHSMPFYVYDVLPSPAPSCTCGRIPAPTFLSSSSAAQTIAGLYRAHRACPSDLLRRDKRQRSDSVTTRVVASTYMPELPVSLWVSTTGSATLANSLALFLYETSHWPNGGEVTIAEEDDETLWGVQDIVFANGEKLRDFVHAWSIRFGLGLNTDVYATSRTMNTRSFRPHLPVYMAEFLSPTHRLGNLLHPFMHTLSSPLLCGSAELLLVDAASFPEWKTRAGPWAVFRGEQIVDWVCHRVAADIATTDAEALGLDALMRTLNPAMGTPLSNRMQAIAAQRNVKLARLQNADAGVIFASKEYHHIQDYAAGTSQRLVDFFRTLTAGEKLQVTATTVRTSALLLNVDGERKLCWKDFSLMRGGGHGRGLGPLVTYYLGERNAAVVLEWMQRWMDEHTRTGSRDSMDIGGPTVPKRGHATPEEELAAARERVANLLRDSSCVCESTRAYSYLRSARGLSDAPAHLIEENEFVRAIAAARYTFGDERRPIHLPAVVFITQTRCGAQVIYLAREHGGGKARNVDNAKKTQGKVTVAADRCDAVPICTPPNPPPYERVFLAEGPETALSVATAFPDAPVYAALGVHNMERFHYEHANTVVLCMEHADDSTREAMRNMRTKTRKRLATRFKHVREVLPPVTVGERKMSDFNDVHQALPGAPGTALVRQTIEEQLGLRPRAPVTVDE